MPVQSDTELFSRLKQGELAPVYLLYGEEHYFSEQAAARIQSLAVSPGFESFNFQRFEGEKLDFSELEDACDALSRRSRLTVRETDVFCLLARGRNRAFICKELVIGDETVKSHVKAIYRKVGVSSREELLERVDEG